MPEPLDRCDNETCRHAFRVHRDKLKCRVTGCACTAFVDVLDKVKPKARRVAIDVPDGYMLSISLVPYTAEAQTAPVVGEESTDAA